MRLPVVIDAAAPRFHCPVNACDLTKGACANRHHLANTSPNPERRLQLKSCSACEVGVANLAGKPMERAMSALLAQRARKEENAMSSTATPTESPPKGGSKTLATRRCARDRTQEFQPERVRQWACGVCDACKAKEGKPSKRSKSARSKPRPAVQAPQQHTSPVAPAAPAPRVLRQGTALLAPRSAAEMQLESAQHLLETIGFRVQMLATPTGPRLLVGAA